MDTLTVIIMWSLFTVLQFLLGIRIKSRLENSIKHEYDKVLEEYKYDIKVREQASKVWEYLAIARILKEDSSEEEYKKANQLSRELAMRLPSELYKKTTNAIVNPTEENNPLSAVIEVRKLLLKDNAGDLTSDNIAHNAPGIGRK